MTGVSPFKLASVLLQYPTVALFDGLGQLAEAVSTACPEPAGSPFGKFLGWLSRTPPDTVARHYVETFDLRRRCALYLTYYRYGDTRKRGMAMLASRPPTGPPGSSRLTGSCRTTCRSSWTSRRCTRAARSCSARTAPTWNSCCGRCATPGPPTPTSSRPSARSSPRSRRREPGAGASGSGSPGRPPKRSAWSRSRRRSTWRAAR